MPTKVFSYGAKPPREGMDLIENQIRLGHRYYNRLIELRRKQMEDTTRVRCEMFPDFDAIEQRCITAEQLVKDIVEEIKAANARAKRRRATAEESARLKAATADLKDAREKRKEIRKDIAKDVVLQERLAAIYAECADASKAARATCGVYWGCVDEETQILTEDGWKTQAEFNGTEKVATYNLDTQAMEWEFATGKTVAHYEGPMAKVKNARLDMMLTPNHRIVIHKRTSKGMKVQVRNAEDMPSMHATISIPQAAPGLEPETSLPVSPSLAAVIGWIVSDGYLETSCDGIRISQSLTANEEYCRLIREDLVQSGVKFNEYKEKDGMLTFYIVADCGREIRKLIPEKLLTPQLVFGLSHEAAKSMFDSLMFGDGCLSETSSGKPRWRWSQKNLTNVAMFQALAFRLGIASHAHKKKDGMSTVSARLQTYSTWQSQIGPVLEWVNFSGTVWCPSTPNTTWVARRNGTIFITGNSYLKVEAAVESAVERTIGLPGFKRWSGGSGQVAVQIQMGCTWQEMLSGSGRVGGLLKAEPLPCNRTSEKSARPWLFSIRVGSDEQRKPVWAKVMVYLHPTFKIPYDGRIMGVSLVRRALPHHRMSNGRYEPRFDWSMQFTVRVSEEKPRATSGACGIDLGWRLVDGGLRVAYLVGSDGHHEELILPTSLVDRWEKSESIQSIRDRSFNEIRAKLLAWMAAAPQPEWFVEQTEHLAQWKSLGRLSRLVASWEERRIDGDGEIFVEMTKWRDQDFHLWQYGAENLLKAQRIRLHIYRNFARRLAMRYGKIFVEDCDWRQIAKKVRVDKNKSNAGAKTYMRIASVGKLRDLLKQDGATMVDSTDTTKKCHACGSIEEFDHAKELIHSCGSCSLVWDQDYNAAVNLLTGGVESGEPEVPAEKKKYVGRFQKRKDKKQQKDQRADDAA